MSTMELQNSALLITFFGNVFKCFVQLTFKSIKSSGEGERAEAEDFTKSVPARAKHVAICISLTSTALLRDPSQKRGGTPARMEQTNIICGVKRKLFEDEKYHGVLGKLTGSGK